MKFTCLMVGVTFFVLSVYPSNSFANDNSFLVIDAHAHIFNGEDVPLDGFVEEVALHISDGKLWKKFLRIPVRPLTKHLKFWADGHHQENAQLDKWLLDNGHPIPPPITKHILAENKLKKVSPLFSREYNLKKIETLAEKAQKALAKNKLIPEKYRDFIWSDYSKLAWWARNFTAPRKSNMRNLLKHHGDEGPVDLFVTALVDMDYWLKGKAKSHLEDQVLINSKLSIMSGGRILPFVAFDPYRNLVDHGNALKLVQKAILKYGFVGVKLYPPMGFKPLGNSAGDYAKVIKNARWRKAHNGIPAYSDKEFADGIERSLKALYLWASENGVPIMAHANRSNSSRKAFKDFANPTHWEAVLEKYPTLKINLGHFGGIDSFTESKKKWAQEIIRLMKTHDNLYADTGNFKLRDKDGFSKYLKVLKNQLNENPELQHKLMYGSDWFMHAARNYSARYPVKLKKAFEKNKVSKIFTHQFMGLNAVEFLGLREGKGRKRLIEFYKTYKVKATWPDKLK